VFDDSITHGFSAYEHNKNYRWENFKQNCRQLEYEFV
jgi:hypothetical protein